MDETTIYSPPRRSGLIFHAGVVALLTLIGLFFLYQASQADVGPGFIAYLLPALICLSLAPVFFYRGYSLWKAEYVLERDGIRLTWGLRREEIPMDDVLWVRRQDESGVGLRLPWLRWPGSILGVRRSAEGQPVEYMASDSADMLLVATSTRVYAITPGQPADFLRTYHRYNELGSLTPIPQQSTYPTFLISRVWSDPVARILLLAGIGLAMLLLAVVSISVPARETIELGAASLDRGQESTVPAVQLMLLPVLNLVFFMLDFGGGLYCYRRPDLYFLAYLLWGVGALAGLFFLLAVWFIL